MATALHLHPPAAGHERVTLPEGVKDEDITASYKDGILEVRAPLPAREEKPPATKVPIARG